MAPSAARAMAAPAISASAWPTSRPSDQPASRAASTSAAVNTGAMISGSAGASMIVTPGARSNSSANSIRAAPTRRGLSSAFMPKLPYQ